MFRTAFEARLRRVETTLKRSGLAPRGEITGFAKDNPNSAHIASLTWAVSALSEDGDTISIIERCTFGGAQEMEDAVLLSRAYKFDSRQKDRTPLSYEFSRGGEHTSRLKLLIGGSEEELSPARIKRFEPIRFVELVERVRSGDATLTVLRKILE